MNASQVIAELKAHLQLHLDSDASTFCATFDAGTLRCDFGRIETMGCEFLSVVCNSTGQIDSQTLRGKCDDLSQRLSYLVEPVRLIEIDTQDVNAQLRSDPPDQDLNARRYFELSVTRTGLFLCRYEKQNGQSRQCIPSVVTNEVLHRLVSDMIETVSS